MTPSCLLRLPLLGLAIFGVTACGVGQAVHDGTVNTYRRVSPGYVSNARIDLRYIPSTPPSGEPPPTIVVRVYQLRAPEAFLALSDEQLLTNDSQALKDDLLSAQGTRLRPYASQSLHEPMHAETRAVGVVVFFPTPDQPAAARLIVPRKGWPTTDPVTIDITERTLRRRDGVSEK
ncbi:type VI secretion system lipoprotein TssJ [Dyella japonica]|uniref:type VI secretion system lipoprotein TssJ n=1 Tax=Dyella japonica TaxID=231455 RepID=UPI000376CDAE|nr:type VI secretion system lipoprotein TssJ [Dyella japonica]